MVILGIETSCDETAIAIIEILKSKNGGDGTEVKILADITRSQAKLHEKFGGVFPNLAKREHQKNLVPILRAALSDASFLKTLPLGKAKNEKCYSDVLENIRIWLSREPELLRQFLEFVPTIEKPPVDLIAVTEGPGLEPCLWTGINLAKALSLIWDIPIAGTNHMEGHIFSALLVEAKKIADERGLNTEGHTINTKNYQLKTINFPAISLLISGGHTELVLMRNWFDYKIVGETRDDAAGEAFDKVARILGLPYPGGPPLSALAERARTNADSAPVADPPTGGSLRGAAQTNAEKEKIKLPRPMLHSDNLDFSFSGLKTAVLYLVKKLEAGENMTANTSCNLHPRTSAFNISENPRFREVIAMEFENAVTEVLIKKTEKAIEQFGAKTLILGGGVSANKNIRRSFETLAKEKTVALFIPEVKHSTDNALMIALAGGLRMLLKKPPLVNKNGDLSAKGNLSLELLAKLRQTEASC